MSGTKPFRRSLRASVPRFVQPLWTRDEDGVKILECHVDGCPKPEIRWEKSGRPIGKSRRVHMIRSGEKCLLQIRMLQADDAGLYTCTAINIVGKASTHIRLAAESEPTALKVNGTTLTLSPIKTAGLRSRSMDRSIESIDDKNYLRPRGPRSRSTSRSSQQDISNNNNSKSKFSFTDSIWKRNESQKSQKLEVITPDKKQLSMSVDDCRKSRRSFFNKVKIPEIFVQKQCPLSPYSSAKHKETISLVIDNDLNLCRSGNTVVKANGSVPRGPLKNRTLNNTPVPKVESSEQSKPVNRIASYLRRFENVDPPVKVKERLNGSLKLLKNERNKDRKNSEQIDSESFFKLGRFIRRKSSGGGKKSPEVSNCSTFVSHVSCDLNVADETVKKKSAYDTDGLNRNLCHSGDSNINLSTDLVLSDSCVNVDTAYPVSEKTATVFPDIIGFSLITDGVKETEKPSICAKEDVLLNSGVENSEKRESEEEEIPTTYTTDKPQHNTQPDFPKKPTDNQFESVRIPAVVNADKRIPSICVDEISETEENDVPDEVGDETEEKAQLDTEENQFTDPTPDSKHCNGNIRYSSSLIEEECEAFPEPDIRPESLESDLQRVSSPIASPARIVKGPQSVTVLRGESITLAICFTGYPVPTVLWMRGGRVLRSSNESRLSILEGREMSVVTVNEVTADDSGKYVVCAQNEGGGDSRFASVAVVGFPEPPGGEPTASEVTDHSLVLSWYGSMYDGGSVVTGYQVEMCTVPDKKWHKVASSVNTCCSVQGLSMGQRYLFRVRAENRYGVSLPSKESKMICLNDFLHYDTSSDEEPEDVPENLVAVEKGTQFADSFDLKEEVGKGRFGTVYRCVELSSGRPRAAKIIRCLKMKDKEKVRQEIEIMSRLHHPKLMQVLAAFESGRNMIVVMEFISGGELFERVIADDFVLTEQDCILFMKQICDGVAYMHKNDVLHLDLKPENILCKTRTSHKIKIIDFGLARMYNNDENLRILFGTPEFVAPEVINYEPVSPASDMWSVGVICYVLLSGLSPFMGDNDTETFSNITRGEMDFDDEAFDEISLDAKDFISSLLIKKTRGRMSAEECLKHPWLATARLVQKRPLSTEKLKRFIIRRKWQKSGTAIRALGRMVSLSRSSLGSSCDSYSPVASPTSSRSRSSLLSRSETAESGDSEVFSR